MSCCEGSAMPVKRVRGDGAIHVPVEGPQALVAPWWAVVARVAAAGSGTRGRGTWPTRPTRTGTRLGRAGSSAHGGALDDGQGAVRVAAVRGGVLDFTLAAARVALDYCEVQRMVLQLRLLGAARPRAGQAPASLSWSSCGRFRESSWLDAIRVLTIVSQAPDGTEGLNDERRLGEAAFNRNRGPSRPRPGNQERTGDVLDNQPTRRPGRTLRRCCSTGRTPPRPCGVRPGAPEARRAGPGLTRR